MTNALRGKKLLVMGGMRISCEIIRKAKAMGCYVVVADYNSIEHSPGKQIADEAFNVDITDVDSTVALIKQEHVDGVTVGFNDMLLPYYAEICEKAGLPAYGTKEQFEIFSNKDKYKPVLRKFNIPTIQEYTNLLQDDGNNLYHINFPVLVKPADGSGAKGISVCCSVAELDKSIKYAKSFSRTGKVLVEEYLDAEEVTVFWLFQDGQSYLTAIGNRHIRNDQNAIIPLPVGYSYPSSVLPQYRQDIEPNCKNMFKALGIKNGMMFMQCKIRDNTCIVYDIGYRLTGSLEYNNIKHACGYDPLEMLIHYALTGKMSNVSVAEKIEPDFRGQYGFNVSCLSAPGTIKEITGIEEVKKIPEVTKVFISHYPGETISENMKGLLAQITVRVLGTVKNKQDIYKTMKIIHDKIHIISDEGNDLLLPGVNPGNLKGRIL